MISPYQGEMKIDITEIRDKIFARTGRIFEKEVI